MAGRVFKRCTKCRREVPGRARSCPNPDCRGGKVVWAFVVNVMRGGNGKRRRLARSGFETKQAAEEAQADLFAETRSGYTPPSKLTLDAYLIDRWLPRTRTSAKTRNDRETHLRAYVIPRIGGLPLQEVTGDHLTEMYDDLAVNGRTRKPDAVLGWGLSATMIRRIHAQLHKAFEDAIRWGLLQRNPCDRADPPSTAEVKARARAVRRTYTWEQLRALVAAAEQDRLYAMWYLFATTGMRRSEMAALLWRNVDLDVGLLSVTRAAVEVRGQVHERELTKSSSSRRAIELDEVDVQVLRQHRKRQLEEQLALSGQWREPERVFTSPVGGRIYPPDITKAFHALTDQAGLPRIRLHDIRHTLATLMLKAGEVTKVVTERLGHSTTAYTQDAYQEVMPGMQRDAALRFRERLLSEESDRDSDEPAKHDGEGALRSSANSPSSMSQAAERLRRSGCAAGGMADDTPTET